MNTIDFAKDVLERSYEKPVVVDFWASWCGPCRVLGPVIEQIAEEQKDRWEEYPEIAQEYQVMSIPNVKMFIKGQVFDEFMGALPRQAILKWLDECLPDERTKTLEEILAQLEEPGNEQTIAQLEDFVNNNPDIPKARVALARVLILTDAERAQELIADIQMDNPLFETASDVQQLVDFMSFSTDDSPPGQAVQQAQTALKADDMETVLQQIIKATTLDKSFGKDLPRKTAIAFFRILGSQHELTKKYRWRFDMALY